MQKDNFFPYVNGTKALTPRPGDLTFYNWSGAVGGGARFQESTHFEVVVRMPKLYLKHVHRFQQLPKFINIIFLFI